mgnify:FL=1|tara:strand:+ start:207 stop:401 length:195 start_codon:yes stop_codon:yes gene_type:complete
MKISEMLDWYELNISESDKIRVQELDSARNEDNGTEIEQEIGSILGNYNSPLLITTKKEAKCQH